ncbi:PTS lactose/cellobiose transporter subunit IIA [Geomicrobium sp. JCM 19039]|uniref:PTS lactose/cellobiose transporter subunit IIA n=1 Tax=Geomicrobium sp. JCM 19039 TaxID=1460636 RepID=UPI00045F2830|nr:PTS lactose/cellobiose transporter subunit IIA [Geomicrobium sp. JCM 19039]GAK12334.1 PTS system, beta-glucoside-specific, IIA component [Geomicrobium sp. JCM 19039]
MNYEKTMTHLILHGGNARGAAYEALDAAEEGNFSEAEEKLKEAEQEFIAGHKWQTELISHQDDENAVPSFVMIHAQDHLMTAQAELSLIKRLILQIKETKALCERVAS